MSGYQHYHVDALRIKTGSWERPGQLRLYLVEAESGKVIDAEFLEADDDPTEVKGMVAEIDDPVVVQDIIDALVCAKRDMKLRQADYVAEAIIEANTPSPEQYVLSPLFPLREVGPTVEIEFCTSEQAAELKVAVDEYREALDAEKKITELQAKLDKCRGNLHAAADAVRVAEERVIAVASSREFVRKVVDILHTTTTDFPGAPMRHLLPEEEQKHIAAALRAMLAGGV